MDKDSDFWNGLYKFRLIIAKGIGITPKGGELDFYKSRREGSELQAIRTFFKSEAKLRYEFTCSKCPNVFSRTEENLYLSLGHARSLRAQLMLQTTVGGKYGRCGSCLSDMLISDVHTQINGKELEHPILAIECLSDHRITYGDTANFINSVFSGTDLPSSLRIGKNNSGTYGSSYSILGLSLSTGPSKDHFVAIAQKKGVLFSYDGLLAKDGGRMVNRLEKGNILKYVSDRNAIPGVIYLGYQYMH